jgi:DNA-binding GntR family transcriptional regulator
MRHIVLIDQQSRLLDTVYERLCDAIFHNEIAAGERLSVPRLASRFGVSRSPIKEAVQQLVSDGIAEAIPRRGVFVANFDYDDVLNLLDITTLLSGMAGRQAVENATDADIERLQDILEQQESAVAANDPSMYAKWDAQFHTCIVQMARNERLAYFLKILHNQIRLVSRLMFFSTAMQRASVADHKAIFRAIRARNPARAERELIEHVRRSKTRIQARGVRAAESKAATG